MGMRQSQFSQGSQNGPFLLAPAVARMLLVNPELKTLALPMIRVFIATPLTNGNKDLPSDVVLWHPPNKAQMQGDQYDYHIRKKSRSVMMSASKDINIGSVLDLGAR